MKRFLIQGLLALACLSFCAGAEAATVVNTFAELRDAVKNPDSLDIQLGGDITITEAIPVSLDAKIDGAGKKLIAGGAFRHFNVTDTPTLEFKNVTFDGGSQGGGVSIPSGGKATFEGGAFESNKAANGGAVSVASGGEATFDGTAFKGNQATGDGGAVSVTGTGKATFTGAITFTGNTATGSGGAVHLDGAAVEFPSSVSFENNKAANGGAVALSDSANSKATFNGNVLSPNTATANGGSLYIPGSAAVVFNADQSFTNNRAVNGGAIWAASLAFASDRILTFTGNTATGNGGALHVDGTTTLTGKFIFKTNDAVKGGAIYAGANLTVSGGTFSGNTASGSGGAICAAGTVTVTGGTFEAGNKAEGAGSDDGGGAIWANEIEVEPSGSDPVTFAGQVARKDGGALFSKNSLSAKNALFTGNEAVTGSGGAVMARGTVTLTRMAFIGNISKQKGGAVYAGDTATITSSVFDGNTAKGDGGAVALDKSTAHFKMTATAMLGNSAGDFTSSGQGGALYLNLSAADIDSSTFSGNSSQSTSDGQGGAVRLQAVAQSALTNCTFTGNTVTGNTTSQGGALWFGGVGSFVLTNCTLSLENETKGTGEKRGGAFYLNAGKAVMAATLAVGNKAELGADIFNGGGTLATGGYNRIAKFGVGTGDTSWANPNVNGDTETDRQQEGWTSATFFGSNGLADNSGPAVGPSSESRTLQTLALDEAGALAAADRAMDKIPALLPGFPGKDERGVDRPQPANGKKDIGAFEVKQSGGGGGNDDPVLTIKSIRMSGIPNTLTSVGQTATLTATVIYVNGTTSNSEKVTWSSSNPSVARIDAFGNIYACSVGKTVISVTVNRQKTAADSADLTVREEMSYTNVHPEIWKMLGEFNDLLGAQGAGLTFAASDPAKVKAATFRNTFREAWGLSSEQVTALKNRSAIRFGQKTLPSSQGWSASKPAIEVALSGRTQGDILPLKYRWSLSWEELSTLMGRKVTQVKNAQELSNVLKLAFVPANGAAYDVVGGEGVSAADAESKGALKVANGNNGLTLELTAFVADAAGPAASSAKGKPQLIDGLLVIPDGTADGTISGALGLLQRSARGGSGGSGSKGEGGGGCDAGVSGMMLALVVAFLLRRKA